MISSVGNSQLSVEFLLEIQSVCQEIATSFPLYSTHDTAAAMPTAHSTLTKIVHVNGSLKD